MIDSKTSRSETALWEKVRKSTRGEKVRSAVGAFTGSAGGGKPRENEGARQKSPRALQPLAAQTAGLASRHVVCGQESALFFENALFKHEVLQKSA